MLIGHSISDADGYILTMDGAVADLLHRSVVAVSGMSYIDLTHPDDVAMNVASVERLAIGVAPTRLRKRYLRPDGTSVSADVHVSRLAIGPDAGRLIGTIYELSDDPAHRAPHRLWRVGLAVDALLRERRAALGDDIFCDHAWMVMIQVYIAEVEGRIADVASIGDAIAIGRARTVRWIRALEAKGLVERSHPDADVVQLTSGGLATIERLLGSMLTP